MPIKSVRQHTLAALHRLRSGWLSTRTARINAVRGILRELGLFIPKGAHFVVPAISELVEDADSDLPTCSVRTCVMRAPRFESSRTSALASSTSSRALAKQLPEVQRLLTIPGIGLLTATAIVGFVGNLRRFPSGRRFSSYLGLVPKENSSGDIRRLGRITKRGDFLPPYAPHAGRTRRAPSGQRQQEPARQAPRLGAEGPPLRKWSLYAAAGTDWNSLSRVETAQTQSSSTRVAHRRN